MHHTGSSSNDFKILKFAFFKVPEFRKSNVFHFEPYLFFHLYDHLCIHCLVVIFAFAKAYKILNDIHKYFILDSHIYFFNICISGFLDIWMLFLSYGNHLSKCKHICLYIMLITMMC